MSVLCTPLQVKCYLFLILQYGTLVKGKQSLTRSFLKDLESFFFFESTKEKSTSAFPYSYHVLTN